MNKAPYKIIVIFILLLLYRYSFSQVPAFYHLSIDNGLNDNHVRSLALSRQGFLWIGTEEGLNLYNGHSFSFYSKDKYPGIPPNSITHLLCDSSNRLWIGTSEGAAFMNSKQQFVQVILNNITQFSIKAIIETTKGIVLVSNLGHFLYEESKNKWQSIQRLPAQLAYDNIKVLQSFNADTVLLATDSNILLYSYAENKIIKQFPVQGVTNICKIKGVSFAATTINGAVLLVNAMNGKIENQYQLNKPNPTDIKQAVNGDLVIAMGLNGVAIINKQGVISYFIHNPIIPASLISNNAYRIVTGANGEVVIGTSTSGISIYNTNLNQAGFTGFFTDATGNYYDNFTGKMLEAGNVIWIGAYDRLIKWDKKNNISSFYYHTGRNDVKIPGNIGSLCMDRFGVLWTGMDGKGISWLSEGTGKFIDLILDTSLSPIFKSRYILDMMSDENGLIWVCTSRGVFTLDPRTKKANPEMSTPLLKELSGKIVHGIFKDSRQRMWFATINNGVYCFEKNGDQLFHYTVKDGLPSDICYMVRADKSGRYFISSSKGLAVINETGVIRSLTKATGLRYDRCESVIIEEDDIAWFSNKKCLVRYDADRNELEFFDEKAGLLNNGFRVGSCLKTKTGELLWGGYRGVSYFNPKILKNVSLPLKVSVYSLSLGDSVADISATDHFKTSFDNNTVSFGFAGTHLGIPGKTLYKYRLKGFDKDWQKGEDIGHARYSALPPGTYSFELKASMDGVKWLEAPQKITITVAPPLWIRWWFIALSVIILAGAAWWFVQNRNKKIRQHKEDLETEKAINHFANSLHEQQTVETILWEVARNCIGRLQFEDCVVYLLDKKKNVLVQKAAYGPKSSGNFEIAQPIEIPIGRGITGSVALTGKGEIVADTSKDSRYIADDSRRLSEIAVPITWGDKVIGVIDCEHHKKNYFNKKHLSILNTIASLCANKIVRARAEEEKRMAESVLTDTQQKMAEVEMQALRAQMNPHFIFNCLNSINRYIVKSDQATASLYLTRFAKLIRLILDNSGNKNVSLSNELEALKLYIEMEALRFDKKFTYSIIIDRNVNTDSIELPPLIIQPYVENAIWHGLLHKNGGGQLTISIKLLDEAMLECIIEDNGVGRSKAGELKSKSATSRKSLGMQLTQNRLALLNRHAELNASITIIDLKNEAEQAAGTKVVLLIPV